jgi:predicted TIM-barrel fold metal-dependent hydrolase
MKFGVISVDQLMRTSEGYEQWVVDGRVLLAGRTAEPGALLGDRNHVIRRWMDVPSAAYRPQDRLAAMDAAGVDCSVLYPTVAGFAGEAFGQIKDGGLELACVQAYNDWIVEEWAGASDRFIPQCIVPIGPADVTVREIERAVAKGHRGVIFPALPMDLREAPHVADPDYDLIWAACAALNVPLCLHAGASPQLQYAAHSGLPPVLVDAIASTIRPVSSVYVLALYLFSRILMRHPTLHVVLAESALSWGMLYLEWADHQAKGDRLSREGYDLTPSELFRRQCYFNAWYDELAPFASYVGADNILWSTNFPLTSSSWPRTEQTIDRCFQGIGEEERRQILWENAAELYRIGVAMPFKQEALPA